MKIQKCSNVYPTAALSTVNTAGNDLRLHPALSQETLANFLRRRDVSSLCLVSLESSSSPSTFYIAFAREFFLYRSVHCFYFFLMLFLHLSLFLILDNSVFVFRYLIILLPLLLLLIFVSYLALKMLTNIHQCVRFEVLSSVRTNIRVL